MVLYLGDLVINVGINLRLGGGTGGGQRVARFRQRQTVRTHPHAIEMEHQQRGGLDACLEVQAHVQIPAGRADVEQFRAHVHRQRQIWYRERQAERRRIFR